MGQKIKILQSSFNKGELSPRVRGRIDNQAYYRAFDYSQNLLPFPEGGLTFRPGTVYVNEVFDSVRTTIIRPFRFSTVQNYVLEFGVEYVRFYRNRGLVETAPGSGVAYEVVTPYQESDLRELYFWQSADVLYIAHPDYKTRKLIRSADNDWDLVEFEFVDGPYNNINIATINNETKAFPDIEITISGASGNVSLTASDDLFDTGAPGDVGRLMRIRVGSGTWTWGEITNVVNATVASFEIKGPNLSSSGTTTSWRFGAFGGAQGWPSLGTIYEQRLILANTISNPSTVWGSVVGDFENFGPTVLSNGSVADDLGFNFTIADDQVNSINWLSAGRTLLIGTTGGEHSLTGGVASGYAPVTPTNVTIKREGNYGSKPNIRAHRIGSAVLYPSQSARKVREIYYEFGIDSYISRDLNLFSEHILGKGVIDMDYAQEPDPYVWAVREDGQLIGFVYDKLQEIEGWHRHIIGGQDVKVESVAVIPRPGSEEDDVWLLVSRTVDGLTKRYIEYISEIFEDVRSPIAAAPDRFYAKFLDSNISYDGYYDATLSPTATTGTGVTFNASSSVFSASDVGNELRMGSGRATIVSQTGVACVADFTVGIDTTQPYAPGRWCVAEDTFSGLDHLESETVGVQIDGYVSDDAVVSSGSVTLETKGCVVHIGLKYEAILTLLPVAGLQNGAVIQGREKSVSELHLYLTDTYGLQVSGIKNNVTDNVKFLNFSLSLNEAPELTTGLLTMHPASGYEKDDQIRFVHNLAMPFTLNYVVQDMDVND